MAEADACVSRKKPAVAVNQSVRIIKGPHAGVRGRVVAMLQNGWIKVENDSDGSLINVRGRSNLEADEGRKPLRAVNGEGSRTAELEKELERWRAVTEEKRRNLERLRRAEAERLQAALAARQLEAQRLEQLERERCRVHQLRQAARKLRLQRETTERCDRERKEQRKPRRNEDYLKRPKWEYDASRDEKARHRAPPSHSRQPNKKVPTHCVPSDKLSKAAHFHILQVGPNAKTPEIKRNFKLLAREYHPDKHCGRESVDLATKVMARINEAFATLKDARSREKYKRDVLAGKAK